MKAGTGSRERLPRDFWLYFAGQATSQLGSSFTQFALPLLVFKLTGSATSLGVTTATTFLPYLLFGLVIGAVSDRVDRKRMMIGTDVGRAVVIGLVPALAAFGVLRVEWIFVIAFAHSTLRIFFDAGEFAAIPSLVPKDLLVTANGRIQASFSVARVLGPALAGLLVAVAPVSEVLLVDAATFVLSAVSLLLIRRGFNEVAAEDRPGAGARGRALVRAVLADVADGLRYVWHHPVLRTISIMMATVNFVAATGQAQLVLLAKDHLSATDSQVGYLFAAEGVGMVLLSLLAGPLRRRFRFSQVALGALTLHGLFTAGLGLTTSYPLGLVLWAAGMGFALLFNINTISLRQEIVPNHLLGRIITIARVLAWSAIPLGAYLGGLVISVTGRVDLVYAAIGLITAGIALGFSRSPLGHAERYIARDPSGSERSRHGGPGPSDAPA